MRKSISISLRVLVTLILVALAGLTLAYLFRDYWRHPWTRDGHIRAQVVAIAPRVSGPITELPITDNQAVKRGDLLFVIDPRPYEFAVQRARAEVAALDGQIEVTQRRIDGQRFAVAAAQAAVQRMEAQLKNATDSLNRLEPLLPKEFVTRDKVDQARNRETNCRGGARRGTAKDGPGRKGRR